jgi:DNA polymerase-3 subunit delta
MVVNTADKLLERLAKGKPLPVVLLLGADVYLRDICRARLIEAAAPEGAREWGVARFSAVDDPLDRVIGQAQTLPMLAPRQIVFYEEVEALESLGEVARDAAVEELTAYLDDPAPFTTFVLEAAKLDDRMKLSRRLAEKAFVVALELDTDPERRASVAAGMALDLARARGVELERDAADELADILNAEMICIQNELEKLASYVGDRRRITRADVEALVISAKKYSVWQLTDLLASRQPARALEFLDSVLREGEQPPQIVGALAWMYRKLIEAQDLPANLSGWQAARELGMRVDTAELALRGSREIPRALLLDGLEALYEADSRLKSGVASQRAVMEFLVARLTGAGAAKRRG